MQKRHKRQNLNTRADGRTSLGMGRREKGKQKVWRRWESYVAACVLRLPLPNSEEKRVGEGEQDCNMEYGHRRVVIGGIGK